MPPSKLETYLKILEAVVDRPRKIDKIARKAHVEHHALKRHLDFMVSNGVVEKRVLSGKQTAYAITERGFSVFKTLRALKYLEKLRNTLPLVDEAREIASVLSRQSKKLKEY